MLIVLKAQIIDLKLYQQKPLAGFGGASVLEIVEDFQTNTYRAVYTVKFGVRICAPCLSEEIEEGNCNTENSY